MALTLSVGQTSELSASATLNSAPVALYQTGVGLPVWTVNNANVALTPSLDGKTCALRGVTAGSSTVTLTVKTSGGTLTATLSVTVAGAGAVPDAVAIAAGTPTGP